MKVHWPSCASLWTTASYPSWSRPRRKGKVTGSCGVSKGSSWRLDRERKREKNKRAGAERRRNSRSQVLVDSGNLPQVLSSSFIVPSEPDYIPPPDSVVIRFVVGASAPFPTWLLVRCRIFLFLFVFFYLLFQKSFNTDAAEPTGRNYYVRAGTYYVTFLGTRILIS